MVIDTFQYRETFRERAVAWLEANTVRRTTKDGPQSQGLFESTDIDPDEVQGARNWQQRKADAGWAVLTWPKEFGGRELSIVEQVIWDEEEAQFQTPATSLFFGIGIGHVGPTIMKYGSEEQQRRYLHRIATGADLWCQLFSEPNAGSDLASLRTVAERSGSQWIINGEKVWTSRAQFADVGFLLARTDANSTGHQGLSCFAVPMRNGGVDIRPIRQISGLTGFNSVTLSNLAIDDDCRIGSVGEGWRVAHTTLVSERISVAMRAMAVTEEVFNQLFARAHQRFEPDYVPIEDAAVRVRVAEYYSLVVSLKLSTYRMLARALSEGAPGPEGSVFKLVQGELLQRMATEALDMAPLGIGTAVGSDGVDWNCAFLTAATRRVGGGTDEIQRNIISEKVLGLPREPRGKA